MREETNDSIPEPKFLQCPYLGTIKEPDNFVNSPSHENFCHKSDPAAYPSNALQKKICLTPLFAQCPVYSKAEKSRIPDELQWKSPIARFKGSLNWGLIPLAAIGFLLLIFLVGNNNNWWASLPIAAKGQDPSPTAPLPTVTPTLRATEIPFPVIGGDPSTESTITLTPTLTPTPTEVPFFLRLFPTKATRTPTATPPPSITTVTFEAGPYIYRGTPFKAAASVTGVGGLNEPVGVVYSGDCTNVSPQGCTATAIYTGDSKHTGSTDSKTIMIMPAPSTTTVTFESGPYVYRGTPFKAAAMATGVGGLNSPVNITYANCTDVSAAGCTATGSFPGDPNHASSVGTAKITITKAPSTTVVTFEAGPYVYRGTDFTAAAAATGVGGLNASVGVTYTGSCTDVSPDGCIAVANYAGDVNHGGSSASSRITIAQAPVTITGGSYLGTYDGSSHSPSSCVVTGKYTSGASCTNGTTSVGPNVGSGSVIPNLAAGSDNFEATSKVNGSWSISAVKLTITAGNYSGTYDGNPHSPAVCSVSGSYTIGASCTNDPSSIGANVGSGSVIPKLASGSINFLVEKSVNGSWSIAPAPLTLRAGSYTGTYDGSPHSPSACTVTGDSTHALVCSNTPASVGPDAGSGTIEPDHAPYGANFSVESEVNGSWLITKAQSTTTVTFEAGPYVYRGTPFTATARVTGAGGLNTTLSVSYTGSCTDAGSCSGNANYPGDLNHLSSNGSNSITIDPAPVTVQAGSGSWVYDGAAHSPSACSVSGDPLSILTCTNNPDTVGPDVGSGSVSPVLDYHGASAGNYDVVSLDGLWVIS